MLKLTFQDITHPDDLDTDLELVQQLLDGSKDSYSLEKRYLRKDSSFVWINLSVKIVRHADGTPRWFVAVVEDISERRQAEGRVRKSYEFLNHMTSSVPDAIFSIKVPERTVLWCNDSYGVLGYQAAECIGQTTAMFYSTPDEAKKMGDLLSQAVSENQELIRTEVMLRRKNGEVFPAEVNIALYREDSTVVSVTALARDISERKQAEVALQESHDLFQHLTTSIPDAVFSVKIPERVIEWIDDSYNVMGLGDNPEFFTGQSTVDFFASVDDYEAFGAIQRKAIQKGENFMRTEVMMRRRDGAIFPAEVTGTFFKVNSEIQKITAIVRDISERKQAEQKLLDYQNRLKSLVFQLTLVEEQERRRIAAELHDDVGQTLAFSQMQLAAVIREQDDAQLREQLNQISDTLLKTSRETRNLVFELSPPTMHEFGLSTAISEWFEERLKTAHEIKLSLYDMLVGDELDEEQYTILFRNIRELLTNVIKHSKASKVQVSLELIDDDVRITVKDNGVGFDPEQVATQAGADGGFGLFSIEERMEDLGGSLEIKARPHQGCTMIMSISINQQTGRPV